LYKFSILSELASFSEGTAPGAEAEGSGDHEVKENLQPRQQVNRLFTVINTK
jgi:hypothetical protein